ncbi:MAG: hypothetical protein JNK64_32265 [Myxococcales bacterium]|nr:hypothetical protein [Myxococcales bacterium]
MIDGATLLGWADSDERRRRGGRPATTLLAAIAAGLALAAVAVAKGGWLDGARPVPSPGFLIAVALVAMVPTMMMAPHRMFWRADAAMVARLPIPGAALWQVALVRARRGALLGVVIAAPVAALTLAADPATGGRFAAIVGALALVAAALMPAVCVGAAHAVASGQADAASRALAGDYAVATTTLLGALPGATVAGAVIATAMTGGWVRDGIDPRGPAIAIGLAVVALLAAVIAGRAAPQVMPRAMREVAALDRQILAHLEIHRATGLERAVAARLGGGAGLVFDRMARLMRRRYPLFALGGALAGIALVAIGLGRPADADRWLAAALAGAGAIAVLLARATAQPAIELPRASATLPIAPAAVTTARRALVGLWLAWWIAAPLVVAIVASPTPARTALWLLGGGAAGAAVVALRRR